MPGPRPCGAGRDRPEARLVIVGRFRRWRGGMASFVGSLSRRADAGITVACDGPRVDGVVRAGWAVTGREGRGGAWGFGRGCSGNDWRRRSISGKTLAGGVISELLGCGVRSFGGRCKVTEEGEVAEEPEVDLRVRTVMYGMRGGLAGLDSLTGGLQAGDLAVVGGRPSMKKMALGPEDDRAVFPTGKAPLLSSLEISKGAGDGCSASGGVLAVWNR